MMRDVLLCVVEHLIVAGMNFYKIVLTVGLFL